jgi:hypothetical protein
MSALAKLAASAIGFGVRVAVGLGKEWWQSRQEKKAQRVGLSHLDSERQVQAARSAGPKGASQ